MRQALLQSRAALHYYEVGQDNLLQSGTSNLLQSGTVAAARWG